MSQTTIPTYDGKRADVRHLEQANDGPRVKVSHPDGREWICVIDAAAADVNVEVSRRDGDPADLDTPAWLTENLEHLAAPA